MKKILLGSCLLIAIALLVSARWGTKAVNAPPQDELPATDTTLAMALSLPDMVSQSDVIAIGNVVETKSVWVDRTLVTLATVSISENLKGSEASTITVELPGGIDANRKIPIAMSYPGAPSLTPGENTFLFLTATGEVAGSYNVTGFSQGKFSIVTDEDGEQVVTRNLTNTSLKSNNGVRRGGSDLMPLANLKERVRGYLKNQ
ncbi:MAG TPA: hypothetical protein VJT69_01350 [Pyrinomonadaceae bacterium]|nr:hypothetical protein [Pyrinomonadaceae bacterium]